MEVQKQPPLKPFKLSPIDIKMEFDEVNIFDRRDHNG